MISQTWKRSKPVKVDCDMEDEPLLTCPRTGTYCEHFPCYEFGCVREKGYMPNDD